MKHTKEYFRQICYESQSATEACRKLGLHFNTFKKYALRWECYITNQRGKGISKPAGSRKIPLSDILNGEQPQYQTNKLKKRLIAEGVKQEMCEQCKCGTVWQGQPLVLHLDHIDGDRHNHTLQNLQLLCPNCHSQTETYCGRNTSKG